MRIITAATRKFRLVAAIATVGAGLTLPLATTASAATFRVSVGSGPFGVAVNPLTNTVYVTNTGDNSVSVIDGSTNALTTTISVEGWPQGVAVNSSTNTVYVTNQDGNSVSVIDGSTNTVTSTITGVSRPKGVAVNPSTNTIYVVNNSGRTVSVINGLTNEVTASVSVGDNPNGVAVNPSTNTIYVTNTSANSVTVINGIYNTVASTITVGNRPYGVTVNPSTNKVYVANIYANSVTVINGSNNAVASTVTVGIGPIGVAVNPSTNTIYVTNTSANSVTVINGIYNTVASTITVGNRPFGVAVNSSTNTAYVPNYGDNKVSVITQPSTPSTPSISNIPGSGSVSGSFTPVVSTTGDGTKSVTSSTTSVCTVTAGTVNYLRAGTCTLVAHVAVGTYYSAADGAAQSFSVLSGAPGAPTNLVATVGDASVTVSFSAPADDGGLPIASYTVTAQDMTNPSSGTNGAACQVSGATNSLSCTISGLTNGDAYAFTATATNSADTSVASLSTGLVTPEPLAANIAVVAQSKKLQVSWTPSSEGAIDSYLVSTVSGDGTICTTTETTCTISWLKNGVTQVIQIDAYDDQGNLLSSVLSDPVAPAGAPLAPLNVTAVAGNRSATISWSAASAQGSAVTTYTVTDEQGNSCSTATLSCTISQLVPGASDAFFVTATNGVGTSPLSVSSNLVVISATPSAPQGVTVTPKLSSLLVSWSPSATNDGSEISKYLVTDSFGNTCMTDQTSCVLSGQSLVNSAIDTVTVVGVNLDGLSSESSAPVTGVTGSLPDAPTGLHAYGGKKEVYLEWTAPFFRGGVPIQNYTVVASNGQSYTTESTNYLITELDGGIGLHFQVFANNDFGSSLYSASADAMAVDVPTAPTGVVATAQDNGSVVVQFNASSGRGLSVDHYTVSDGNGHYCETTSTSCTVSGLSLGHTYRFNVVATNGRGDSAPSLSSVDVLAAALPEAPHDLFVTGGNHSVLISWQAGADNGSTVSSYKVSSDGPAGPVVLCQTSQTSCAIGGLSNGAPYQFTVKATNGVGTSDASTLSPVVVPAGVPNTPTNLTAVVGDGSVTLSWTGSSTNGTPVTSYTVSANDGSSCDTPNGEQTTCAISGLTNGQTYSFYVVTNSLAGSSLANSVRATPIGVPTAPQQVSVVAGNGSAVISFGPPAFNGGSIVTRYVVVSDGLGGTCWKQAAGSCRIFDLTNGQTYTFTVVAINAAGPSTAVSVEAMPAGPPSRPTVVVAQALNGKALVMWTPPADNGSKVLSYTVTSSSSSKQSCTSTTSSCVVSGLRNGESYFFLVKATNALGTSNPSAASNEVTPAAPPTAPQNLAAVPGDGAATFSWNAPQNTNGAAVTSYRVTNGVNYCETTTKTCTVTGLTNGQASVFIAYAQNAAGTSVSSASVQVVPATVAGAPTISSVTSIATGLEVAFVPPTINGGAPVTSYLVSVNGGATFAAVSAKSLTGSLLHLTGLTAGSTYSVALKAVNSAGASSRSEAVSATYVTTASSPKIISVNSQKTSVVVNYAAPSSTGGTPIVAYQYSLDRGVTWRLVSYGTPTNITITGLLRHLTYRLQLRAVNSAGIGSASSVKVVRTA